MKIIIMLILSIILTSCEFIISKKEVITEIKKQTLYNDKLWTMDLDSYNMVESKYFKEKKIKCYKYSALAYFYLNETCYRRSTFAQIFRAKILSKAVPLHELGICRAKSEIEQMVKSYKYQQIKSLGQKSCIIHNILNGTCLRAVEVTQEDIDKDISKFERSINSSYYKGKVYKKGHISKEIFSVELCREVTIDFLQL